MKRAINKQEHYSSRGWLFAWNWPQTFFNIDLLKIGGIGKIFEVDESLFSKRRNNARRVLPQQWISGGVCQKTNGSFLIKVENGNAETLLMIIAKKSWKEIGNYFRLLPRLQHRWAGKKAGFGHLKVNHKYHFVDPDTGFHI